TDVSSLYNSYDSQLALHGGAGSGGVNLGQGLVGWWPLNGNAKDSTPYSDDGTPAGATQVADREGRSNSAFSFTGSSGSWLNFGNASILQQSQGTLSAWIKTSSTAAAYYAIFAKQNAYGMFVYGGNLVAYDWGTASRRDSGFSVADNSWHMVTMSYRSGVTNGTILYVDGAAKLTTTMTITNQTVNLSLSSGNTSGTSQNLNGQIDDARFWNRALSASEVSQLHNTYN
ncbi:MAG: LamG domain-containing protein, partial [Candidatus Angelobacter sp.]